MTKFTIEVMVGDENRIVQVESPTGDDYLELISRFQGGENLIAKQDYACLIDFSTDLAPEEVEKMGPRAMMKTLNACGFALEERKPDSENELTPDEFGNWSSSLV